MQLTNYALNLMHPENCIVCRFLFMTQLLEIYDQSLKRMATAKLCLIFVAKMAVICKLYCKL